MSHHDYIAYGLRLRSELELPELVRGEPGEPDVEIRFGEVPVTEEDGEDPRGVIRATETEVDLYWKTVGGYRILRGREIVIDPAKGVDEGLLRVFLLGAAFGVLLHQRNHLVLHASAARVGDRAVAFVAWKRWGKSTTAAAMHARGHPFIADDIVAIDVADPARPQVIPGFPQIKLWPDAVASLGFGPEELPRLHSHLEKRSRLLGDGFVRSRCPLGAIFVLDKGERLELEDCGPQEAFSELIRHAYAARFGQKLLRATGLSDYFQKLVTLARHVPVYRLRRPPSLDAMDDITRMVEERLAVAA